MKVCKSAWACLHLEREAERTCALLANPATAFQRLILSHIPGEGNSKQMASGSSEVCFIAVAAALRAHRQAPRVGTGQGC